MIVSEDLLQQLDGIASILVNELNDTDTTVFWTKEKVIEAIANIEQHQPGFVESLLKEYEQKLNIKLIKEKLGVKNV